MAHDEIMSKINSLLIGSGYTKEVNSLTDLRKFLHTKGNYSLKSYDEIKELYEMLILGQGMW